MNTRSQTITDHLAPLLLNKPPQTVSGLQPVDRLNRGLGLAEKIRFLAIGVAMILAVPVPPIGSILNLLEVTTAVFVLFSPHLRGSIRRCFPVLIVLSCSILTGWIMGTSGLADKMGVWVFLKVVMYVLFIDIMALNSRVKAKRNWMLSRVVIPVTALVMLSVLLDLYTPLKFGGFHARFTYHPGYVETMEGRTGLRFYEVWDRTIGQSGLAYRLWHLPAWAVCGLLATFTLARDDAPAPRLKWPLVLLYLVTPTLLPHRYALVTLGSFLAVLIALSLLGRSRLFTRVQPAGIALLVAGVLVYRYLIGRSAAVGTPTAMQRLVMKYKVEGHLFLRDPRIGMYLAVWQWFLDNPYALIFGTGWNQLVTYISKPHSLYLGLLVGTGITGSVALAVFLRRLWREQLGDTPRPHGHSDVALAGLCSLLITGVGEGYLNGRLTTPAFFLALWIALILVSLKSGQREDRPHGSVGHGRYGKPRGQ